MASRRGTPVAPRPSATGLLIASLALVPGVEGLVCTLTSKNATRALPRAWRSAADRLHSLLGCDIFQQAAAPRETEDYLRGLEHPVVLFGVELHRRPGELLGFDVKRKSDFLEVERVRLSGALVRWNNDHPARAIHARDRVIKVNDVRGNVTSMAEELKLTSTLVLRVIRINSEDMTRLDREERQRELQKVLKISPPPDLGEGIREPPDSRVVVLHARNIDKFVAVQPVTLLMFYASWCGHCKELAPEYTKAAGLVAELDLPRAVGVAKFDDGDAANRDYQAASPEKYNFTSFPALFVVMDGKPEQIGNVHGAAEIAALLAAKVKGLDVESEMKNTLRKLRPMLYRPDVSPEKVLDLEPETFDEQVLANYEDNNRVWIIEYYSDKCPLCRSLKPEYIKASDTLLRTHGASVKFAAVNSRAFHDLAERFGVTSYPWIIAVYAGAKLEDMAGLGGADSIIRWATLKHSEAWRKSPAWATEFPRWPSEAEGEASAPGASLPAEPTGGTWRELLGRRTWFFLHTVAAKYPEEPTEADKAGVVHLVAALGQHYPCPLCRKHLQAKLAGKELGPVPTSSRTRLTEWFCRLHNTVNVDLNKSVHSCNAFELDLQYLKSCGECSASKAVDEDLKLEAEAEFGPSFDFFRYLEAATSGGRAPAAKQANSEL